MMKHERDHDDHGIWIINQVKRCTPLSKLVSTCCPAMLLANAAQIGLETGFHHHSLGGAAFQTLVPRKQTLEKLQRRNIRLDSRASNFSTGMDSPVRSRLCKKQVLRREQPDVRGNHVTGAKLDDVSGHQFTNGASSVFPRAQPRWR